MIELELENWFPPELRAQAEQLNRDRRDLRARRLEFDETLRNEFQKAAQQTALAVDSTPELLGQAVKELKQIRALLAKLQPAESA